MDYSKLQKQSDKLHAAAKDGKTGHYSLVFDKRMGHYVVTDDHTGEWVTNLNTRKITVAKKWLREYLEK